MTLDLQRFVSLVLIELTGCEYKEKSPGGFDCRRERDLQQQATECGLLVAVQADAPCNDEGFCTCLAAGTGFPMTCYRYSAAWVEAASPALPTQ